MKYRYDFSPEGIIGAVGNCEVIEIVRDDGIRIRGGISYDTDAGTWAEKWPEPGRDDCWYNDAGDVMIEAHDGEEGRMQQHTAETLRELQQLWAEDAARYAP